MDAKTIEAVTAKTNDLLAAPSCNPMHGWLLLTRIPKRRHISMP